ncbi:MAG: RHS repeat-associated core domain-containing protein, partial [Solirubrobacteraceae bacterium]
MKIDPVAGGATSSTLQFDTASGPSVGFIQRMPVTKRVVRVAVGRFAASSSCTTPARVQLFVREHPTGDDAVSSQVAYSPAYASIDQTPQDVSLSIPATTFVKGRGYSFSVLWAGGPCRQVSQTVWDRAPGDGHVASGSGTCDLGPITSGSGGTGRRMWHEFGLSDRDSQCATTTLNGAAFGADMPTGWLVVGPAGYVMTGLTFPFKPSAPSVCGSAAANAGARVVEWRGSPGNVGSTDYVCVWPQWAQKGSAGGADGWYHGLPWLNGVPRDSIIRLATNTSQFPANEEQFGPDSRAEPGVTHCDRGDPVNCATGNLYEDELDLRVGGRSPLAAARTYNAQLAAAQDRAGQTTAPGTLAPGWTHAYGTRLELIDDVVVLHAANGATSTFTAGAGGSFSAPERVKAGLVHHTDGTYTLTYRDHSAQVFDSIGRLLRERDRNGYATTLDYSPGGRLQTVINEAGRALSYDYDGAGRLATISDPLGHHVGYGYDSAGDLRTVTDVAGGVTRYGYDSRHRMSSMTDARGHETTTEYDSEDRATKQTNPAGGVTSFAYTSSSSTVTDPRGNQTRYEQTNGLTTKVVRAVGTPQQSTVEMVRDASGNVTRRTDPNGQVTTLTYDAQGSPTRITDPLGRVTTMTYTAANDVKTITDPDATTTLDYDAHGNLTSVSRPLTGTSSVATTTHTYDPNRPGDRIATTDPNGKVWRYTHDSDGNPASTTDPEGNRTTNSYNADGWLTSSVSARGNAPGADPGDYTRHLTHNQFGDPTRGEDPLGHATQTTYDANRNATSLTAPDGEVTRTTYDELDRPTTVTRPDDSALHFAYDANGNRTSVKDGLNHETTFAYDPADRVTRQIDALDRASTYAYDASGRHTTTRDPAGRTTTHGYDAASQLTSISYSDSDTYGVSYAYDELGRRIGMTDGTGTSTSSYDSLGRLSATTDGAGRTLGYRYDLAGNVTKITYPPGLVAQTAPGQTISDPSVTRAHDDAGRLTSVTDWLGSTTGFSYDANGNLTEQRYPNDTTATLTYDRADELTQRTDNGPTGTILDLPYTRNANGQIQTHNQTATQPGATATLDYDARRQLSTLTVAGQVTASYAHDLADRLTRTDSATTATGLDYDAANQLTRTVDPATGEARSTLTYDELGNRVRTQPAATAGMLTPPRPTSYSYDQANRLTRVHKDSTSILDPGIDRSYSYDGDGLRADLLWDQASSLPLILADSGALYITGPDGLPLEQLAFDGTRRYYHHDQLGSTRALTTTTATIAARSDYDPYGNPTTPTTAATNPFGYAGQYTDHTTGLIYMRARWYDPTTGQFITADPSGHASGETNLYRYAAGDPANHVDPSGLCSVLPWSSNSCFAEPAAQILDGITAGISSHIASAVFGFDAACAGYANSAIAYAASMIGAGKIRGATR